METWSQSLDFSSLGKKFGSPLYVFSPAQLKHNFDEYLKIVGAAHKIAIPIKANPALAPLRYLAKWGAGADAASMNEVKTAELAGIDIKDIVYNSPAANLRELSFMLLRGGSVVIDSTEQLETLERELEGRDFLGKVFLRINPAGNRLKGYSKKEEWQKYTSHALSGAKFGIAEEDLIDLLEKTRIPICGLHLHAGTQMDNVETFVSLLKYIKSVALEINKRGLHQIRILDFGGGLGIAWNQEQKYPTIQDLGEALREELDTQFDYLLEPGNSIFGNTMGIITQVKSLKKLRSKRWAITDVGNDQIITTILTQWQRQILREDHQPLPMKGEDSIGGPLCFSGDILLPNTQLDHVKTGDYLFVQHCGSYCYALASHFNGRLMPAMVEVDEQGVTCLVQSREREAFSDNIFNHQWRPQKTEQVQEVELSLETMQLLRSTYLKEQVQQENYEILNAKKKDNFYEAEIKIDSPVSFVSVPLATRIFGDLGIIFSLHLFGKRIKDISVWADELILNAPKPVSSRQMVKVEVSMSAVINHKNDEDHTVICYFSINQEAFSGTMRFRFSCPLQDDLVEMESKPLTQTSSPHGDVQQSRGLQ